MKTFSWIIGAVILLAVVAGGWWLFRSGGEKEAPLRSASQSSAGQALALALKDYSGDEVRLSDFLGTPLVINAWAAWCPFCHEELKDFAVVQQEFSGKVRIVAIDRAEALDVAKGYTDTLGVSSDLVFLLDPTDSFYAAIGGFAMPETIFVKGDGTIHFHKRGVMSLEEIRQRTQDLIKPQ